MLLSISARMEYPLEFVWAIPALFPLSIDLTSVLLIPMILSKEACFIEKAPKD